MFKNGLVIMCMVFLSIEAQAEEYVPTGFVNDFAHVLKKEDIGQLEVKLETVKGRGEIVFVIATVPSLGGQSVEEFALNLARQWKIGDPEKNNGVLLLVAPTERKVRIELGTGIDGRMSRDFAQQCVNAMARRFKEGKMDVGIVEGAHTIADGHWAQDPPMQNGNMLVAFFILVVLISFIAVGIVLAFSSTAHSNIKHNFSEIYEIIHEGLEENVEHPDVRRQSRFAELLQELKACEVAFKDREDLRKLESRVNELHCAFRMFSGEVRRAIATAQNARTRGPELLQQLPDVLAEQQAAIDTATDAIRQDAARKKLQEARDAFVQARAAVDANPTAINWLMVYALLCDAQSSSGQATNILSGHHSQSSHDSYYGSSSDGSGSFDAGSFGGGSSFGGGGASAGW